MISKLIPVAVTSFGIQTACFLVAAPLQTEKFYDLSGSLTYMGCIAVSLLYKRNVAPYHWRQLLVSATTIIWAGRLGSFLFSRMLRDGKDDRFAKIKTNPIKFSIAWMMQATWVMLVALPVFAVNASPVQAAFGLLDIIGTSIWACGFTIEVMADRQKAQWQERIGHDERKRNFINEGLWSISRHPNYFGEILLWVGNYITCAGAFRHLGVVGLARNSLLFAVSPMFIGFLLTKVSGIPMLEKLSDSRFKDNAAYQKYKKEVPILIPKLSLKFTKQE